MAGFPTGQSVWWSRLLQKLITCSCYHSGPLHKISLQSKNPCSTAWVMLLTDKQKERQTNLLKSDIKTSTMYQVNFTNKITKVKKILHINHKLITSLSRSFALPIPAKTKEFYWYLHKHMVIFSTWLTMNTWHAFRDISDPLFTNPVQQCQW